jgi:hypothetical protein
MSMPSQSPRCRSGGRNGLQTSQIHSGAWKILSMVIFGLAERLHWIESGALPETAVAIIDEIVSAIACE